MASPERPLTPAARAVIDFAGEVLGKEANTWLIQPHEQLDGKAPYEIVRAYPGKVEKLLLQIKDPIQV